MHQLRVSCRVSLKSYVTSKCSGFRLDGGCWKSGSLFAPGGGFVHVILSDRTKWCDCCCRCASCHSKRRGLHGRQCCSLYFIVPSGLHLIALGSRAVASPAPSPGLIDSPWQWLCSSERKKQKRKKKKKKERMAQVAHTSGPGLGCCFIYEGNTPSRYVTLTDCTFLSPRSKYPAAKLKEDLRTFVTRDVISVLADKLRFALCHLCCSITVNHVHGSFSFYTTMAARPAGGPSVRLMCPSIYQYDQFSGNSF